MQDWLTAQEAMARLRLKPQTLYAYVSRGLIEARDDSEDSRRSLYRAEDVARLEHRKARGRRPAAIAEDTIAYGEPVLASGITTIERGGLWYRGQDAVRLAESARLEDIARLLWDCGTQRFPPLATLVPPGEPLARVFAVIAARAASDRPMAGRAKKALYLEAAAVLDALVDAIAGGPGAGPIHARLARAWGCEADGAEPIRRALVLLADHELNASTFAARVTASTGASLAACAMAGLAALSGPLHGGVAPRVLALMRDIERDGLEATVAARLETGAGLPGFGHPLYSDGDPRARALLAAFEAPSGYAQAQAAIGALTGEEPNIDFALAALAARFELRPDAPFQIFAAARCTGWLAHALEQNETGRLIRPRARYVGLAPTTASGTM
ncbi:MAG: citrate synthase family protein [Bosea sp.]|uniref:citrate synthase family protein n=1 Tax=Bosea sp. (in: a-proteobacteria) TaxID=1871050 RepID=UPI001AC4C06A|nr:citrate synthase family protein [Bosea sp. (in: a-proteobacteria)]MBN9467438.1 citrate synthase family protein [Bosea sp. (in: a-proteobacteria)]